MDMYLLVCNFEEHYLISLSLDLSFKRLINGEEVRYYVRIFSKLPNWKFSEEKPTEENMYKDGGALITDNQDIDFENHIGKY